MSEQIEDNWDAVILGAGISGLVSANVLHRQGIRRILIIDEYSRVGGNHIDVEIGSYTYDIGTIIFSADSPLLDHFPELLGLYQPIRCLFERVAPDGSIRRYPFSFHDDVIALGPIEWVKLAASLMCARLGMPPIRNAADYATYWIGARAFAQTGLAHYIERFYAAPPSEIERTFAEKRMHEIAEKASIKMQLGRFRSPAPKNHNQFVRPRKGFSNLYASATEKLGRQGTQFALGSALRSITKGGGAFHIEATENCVTTKRLISTIPLARTTALCGLPSGGELRTVTLISLFLSFDGVRGFAGNVLYNFSHLGQWKRLTMFSDFYGTANGREYLTVEVNWMGDRSIEAVKAATGDAFDDFLAHNLRLHLFDGELTLEGSFSLDNAYPIYTKGATEVASAAITRLKEFGIESFGRQGGFDYLPTAAVTAYAAQQSLSTSKV